MPNGYTSYQISPNLWLGLGINAPFGLSVSFQEPWAGRNYRRRHDDKNLQRNIPASLIASTIGSASVSACKFSTRTSQISSQGCQRRLSSGTLDGQRLGLRRDGGRYVHADARRRRSALGGVRRSIRTSMGTMLLPAGLRPSHAGFGRSSTLNLPDIVTLGIRQQVDPRVDGYGYGGVDQLEPDRHGQRQSVERSARR